MGGPVKIGQAYHLLKVTDIKTPKYEELTQENKQAITKGIIQKEVEKIKIKENVKVFEENLKKIN